MYEAYQLEPTIEPLQKVLGHLADMIRLDQQTGEHRQADGGLQFVLHQHELDDLPGITHDAIDEDGPVWLAVERPSDIAPPPPEYDLESWIEVSADPEQQPLVRDSVVITVGDIEKDLMVAAEDVRAEDCAPAIAPEAASAMWNVRLRLDRRPDLAARISAYVTGPWTAWAESARRRHRATPIYRRLHEMAELADLDGADRTWELVFGIGVSRWQHRGGSVEVPLLERLVEIEVAAGPAAEIRIRPRMVGAIVNLGVFEALSPDAARLARHGAGRILEAIERGGEVSPFVRESFEPILRAISSELDPQGIYRPDPGPPHSASSSPDAGEQLVVSDRWVIFARPRGNGFVRRDIDRLKLAIEQSPNRECCLSAGSGVLPSDAGGGGIAVVPQALSGVPGEPVDIASAARADGADNGDPFYPLPASPDQIDIVRQLARSDGVVVEGARGAERTDAIVNVVCHYLALGRRVLVVSRKVARLALVRERLPRAIRDLTVSLTATDKEGLRQAEGVVARLQSIVETLNLRDQGTRINRLQHHILRTRREISGIDEEVANIADSSLQRLSGIADQQFDPVKTLLEDRNAHSWLDDRPRRLLSATDPLVAAMTLAREARARVAEELIHIDDELPQITELPDPEALVRLHEELRRIRIVAVSPADSSEGVR
ncbi:MAG: helicase, partial [Xanthobacteraceae bacterium]